MSKSTEDLRIIMENLSTIDFDKVEVFSLTWKLLVDPDPYGSSLVLPELGIKFKA